MFRLPIQIAARFAIYAGARSLAETALTDNLDMDADNAQLPAAAVGLGASFVIGQYTDQIVNVVADSVEARRERKNTAE